MEICKTARFLNLQGHWEGYRDFLTLSSEYQGKKDKTHGVLLGTEATPANKQKA